MKQRFQLNNLVLHYIGFREVETEGAGEKRKEKWQQQATTLQEITALDQTITNHLLALIAETWNSPDTGDVHSARFDPSPRDPARVSLRSYLGDIKKEVWSKSSKDPQAARNSFLRLSQKITDRLFDCTTLAASPGLLMVADFSSTDNGDLYLALLKVRHTDERFVTILQDSLTDLQVKDVEMMLTQEILKGVIWPHPTRPDYDLKLVDRQAKAAKKPARYFTEAFLGCLAKDSDTRQTRIVSAKLLSEISKKCDLELDSERTDAYIADLVAKTEPTAERIAVIASETGLIEGAEPDQLRDAIEEELEPQLPNVLHARQLEPDLKAIAEDCGWTYHPERKQDFCLEMDHAMRLDEKKVTDVIIETEVLKDAEEGTVLKHLEEIGGVDIPRETWIMRTKTQRRVLQYHFSVPRRPASPGFVRVTISGPPETVRRFLSRQNGGNYVFSIGATPENFDMEYK
jgi:hypothetical protein